MPASCELRKFGGSRICIDLVPSSDPSSRSYTEKSDCSVVSTLTESFDLELDALRHTPCNIHTITCGDAKVMSGQVPGLLRQSRRYWFHETCSHELPVNNSTVLLRIDDHTLLPTVLNQKQLPHQISFDIPAAINLAILFESTIEPLGFIIAARDEYPARRGKTITVLLVAANGYGVLPFDVVEDVAYDLPGLLGFGDGNESNVWESCPVPRPVAVPTREERARVALGTPDSIVGRYASTELSNFGCSSITSTLKQCELFPNTSTLAIVLHTRFSLHPFTSLYERDDVLAVQLSAGSGDDDEYARRIAALLVVDQSIKSVRVLGGVRMDPRKQHRFKITDLRRAVGDFLTRLKELLGADRVAYHMSLSYDDDLYHFSRAKHAAVYYGPEAALFAAVARNRVYVSSADAITAGGNVSLLPPPIQHVKPSKVALRRYIFAHHKTGFKFSKDIQRRLENVYGLSFVSHGGSWFGQPLSKQFEKLQQFRDFSCGSCFRSYILRPNFDRVVNIVRDPATVVVSGYLYHVRGEEKFPMAFTYGGERGADLCVFFSTRADELELPRPNQTNYPEYLAQLGTSRQGILAEMLRVREWELPEIVESVRTTRRFPTTFKSLCLEAFYEDAHAFLQELFGVLDADPNPHVISEMADALILDARTTPHATRTAFNDSKDHFELLRLVMLHDARSFGGYFSNASAEVGCRGHAGTFT